MNPVSWLQSYLSKLALVISTPHYYLQVAQSSWLSSISFLLFSCLWLGVAMASVFTFVELPQMQQQTRQAWSEFVDYYPSDLVVTWNGSELSSNASQAVPIYYPSQLNADRYNLPARLAYFLPSKQTPSEAVNSLPTSAWILITPDKLYMSDLQGVWSDLPLAELKDVVPSMTLNTTTLPALTNQLNDVISGLSLSAALFSFAFFPLYLVVLKLWLTTLESFLAYLLSRLNGLPLSYSHIWKMSLHVMIVVQILEQIADLLYPNINFPLTTVAYWLYMSVIFFSIRSRIIRRIEI